MPQTDVSADQSSLSEQASAAPSSQTFYKWGCLSMAIYAAFLCYYNSNLVDAKYVNHHISNLIVTIPGVILLLLSYRRGYLALKNDPSMGVKPVVLIGGLAALIAICIPNFHSSDVFSYIDVGWLQSHYHLNPYVTTVDEIPGFHADPMLTGVWAWNPCPYGFAFAHLTKLLCHLGGGDLTFTMRIFKFVNLLAFFTLAAVIYFGAKGLQLPRPDLSLYLYLFSPFVILQSLSNAHNDVLMTLFVMVAMLLAGTNLVALATPALVVGAQIKFLWIVAFPFVLLFIYQRAGVKALVTNIVAGVAVMACLAVGYAGDLNHFRFDIMRQDLSFNGKSLPALIENIGHGIERLLFHSGNLPWFEAGLFNFIAVLKVAILVGFALLCIWLFRRAVLDGKKYSLTRMIEDCLLLALIAVCLVSSKFHPWYILMFFPVALWLPERSDLRRLAIILSCTQLFAITYLGHSGGINFVLLTATPLIIFFIRYRRQHAK